MSRTRAPDLRDPRTPEEWQEAADSAVVMLGVESARLYGLIETDLEVDVERCEAILARAPAHGATVRDLSELLPDREGAR